MDSELIISGLPVKPIKTAGDGVNISAVVAIIFDSAGRVLMVKNPRGWDFPGGHVEESETPEIAVKREIAEEASVSVQNCKLFLSAGEDRCMLFFAGEVNEILPFNGGYETTGRDFIDVSEFAERYSGGMPELAVYALQKALEAAPSHPTE